MEEYGLVFWIVAIFAALSDLEGYLARKWSCATPIGAMLDIVADKSLIITLMAFSLFVTKLNWRYAVPIGILLAYHVSVMSLRAIGTFFAPSRIAKLKTAVEMPALIGSLWSFCIPWHILWLDNFVDTASVVFLFLAAGMAIWSMGHYLKIIPDVTWNEKS